MLHCVIKDRSKEFEELFIDQIKEENDTINYYKLCEIISLYQYNLHFAKYTFFKKLNRKPAGMSLRPTSCERQRNESEERKSFKDMDTIIDYIWCRLSEKYVKLSKGFRNMDVTIVLLFQLF